MKKLLLILLCLPLVVCASFPVLENKTTIYNDSCDNIILKNGEEISAKIIEITPDLIKYKKCGKLEGPLISIYKKEVLMLRYNDGSKDIISPSKEYRIIDNKKKRLLQHGITSLVCAQIACLTMLAHSFIPTIFLSVSAILFGITALKEKFWQFGLGGLILGGLIFLITLMNNSSLL